MKKREFNIRKASLSAIYIKAFFTPAITFPMLSLFFTILKDFFLIQFAGAIFSSRYKRVNLDHPLDEFIPFRPEHVGIYMDFTPMWGRAFWWAKKKFGSGFHQDFAGALLEMKNLYKTAARVYRHSFSTTNRPKAIKGSLNFRLIHLFDPHLNCLPSLHIMVIWYCWYALRELVIKHDTHYTRDNVDECPEIRYLHDHAAAIGESVLLVKQHSVNCIPAALYMLTRLFPGFTEEMSETIMGKMFVESEHKIEHLKEIHCHMLQLYNQFLSQGAAAENLIDPLVQFLDQYHLGASYVDSK